MNPFIEYMLLAIGGHAFHLAKMYNTSIQRKETFITKGFLANEISNLIAIPLLVYIGPTLPPELFVMSPITAVVIGFAASSLLAGFINVKKPKDAISEA